MPRQSQRPPQTGSKHRNPVLSIVPKMTTSFVFESPVGKQLAKKIRTLAPSSHPILITGPTGSGKEVVARLLHQHSERKGNFVVVHCGNITDGLFEDELFGHRRGAFTGAEHDRLGMIGEAEGGTLFLDEVGELPARQQVKLLRLLSEQKARTVGCDGESTVDIRVLAATNRDIFKLLACGRMRKDFYGRLRKLRIEVPPFRQRIPDVIALARLFAHREGFDKELVEELVVSIQELSRHTNAWAYGARDIQALVAQTKLQGTKVAQEFLQYEWQRLVSIRDRSERVSDVQTDVAHSTSTRTSVDDSQSIGSLTTRLPVVDTRVLTARHADLAAFIQEGLRRIDAGGIKAAKARVARALAPLLARASTVERTDIARALNTSDPRTIDANIDKLCTAGLLHIIAGERDRYQLTPGVQIRFMLHKPCISNDVTSHRRDRRLPGDWTLLNPMAPHAVEQGDRLCIEVTTRSRMIVSVGVISHRMESVNWDWLYRDHDTQPNIAARYTIEFDDKPSFEHVLLHITWPVQRGARIVNGTAELPSIPSADRLTRARYDALAQRSALGFTSDLLLHHR